MGGDIKLKVTSFLDGPLFRPRAKNGGFQLVSNTIKENPEVWKVNSSLVFGENHKYYGFLESLEPQDG